ncbi:MAG: YcgN family cysteine cluster protein [Ostreibacterium sp.]
MKTVKRSKIFWNNTPLSELSAMEWEALCDGCGKCCLHKLEDDTDGAIYYTDLACYLLDLKSCRCRDYSNRHINVPDCIAFNADDVSKMHWLPDTCAYRLRQLGEPLYDWHYLISGDKKSVHKAKESISDFAEIDRGQELEEHIIYFKP